MTNKTNFALNYEKNYKHTKMHEIPILFNLSEKTYKRAVITLYHKKQNTYYLLPRGWLNC